MADANEKAEQPTATATVDSGTDAVTDNAVTKVDEGTSAAEPVASTNDAVADAATSPSHPPPQSPPTSRETKELAAAKDDKDEAISRKRDREGSVEPSSTAAASAKHLKPRSSDALPAKKNRIIDTSDEEPSSAEKPSSKAAAAADSSEKGKVGQIRRRVEELSYEERESKRADTGARRKSNESTSSITEGKESDTASTTEITPVSPPTSARKQPTFSSFSSSSSPFASSSASAGVSGPSWLAGSSSSSGGNSPNVFANGSVRSGGISGSTGAIRPSALGGGGASDSQQDSPASSSSSSKANSTSTATATTSGKAPSGLGFGAFAGSRPFTKSSTPQAANTPSPGASTPTGSGDAHSDAGEPSKALKESVFDKVLKEDSAVGTPSSQVAEPGTPAAETEQEETTQKVNIQKKADAELATGEEEERTVHSVRAKLYAIMKGEGENATSAADGQWKERGTGTVRVNVPRERYYSRDSSGSAPRLVMRAEGVLRLILNVALFSGMKVELAQDKFVRFVAVEEGALVHFALRVSNPTAAHSLYQAIKSRIPAQKKTAVAAGDAGELA